MIYGCRKARIRGRWVGQRERGVRHYGKWSLGSSEAGGVDLGIRSQPTIRPISGEREFMCGVCGKDGIQGIDSDADYEAEEGIKVEGVEDVYLPSHAKIDDLELKHLPFRGWCSHCIQGKGVSAAHKQRKIEESKVPVVSTDYMG